MKKRIMIFLLIFISILTIDVYAETYSGDYSIEEMLQNYNLITFGKKDLDSRMPSTIPSCYSGSCDFNKGDANLFHINSKFLINGKLRVGRIDSKGGETGLKSYMNSLSYMNGTQYGYVTCGYCGGWGSYQCGGCFSNATTTANIYSDASSQIKFTYGGDFYPKYDYSTTIGNYMDFDQLYESITNKQKEIKKGKAITSENGIAHIETGGEYYINDINEINSIMFDNFEANENKLTVITINNTGEINFPKIYETSNNNEGNLVSTNDYLGMPSPAGEYADYFVLEKYYGNIIWNIPNATYIELPSAPFIGHLIAPNADVQGPELHYAGAFLVNSLYLPGSYDGNGGFWGGGSEAHFYPLQITDIPYGNPDPVKAEVQVDERKGNIVFNDGVNPNELEEGTIVSFKIQAKEGYTLKNLIIKDEQGNIIEFRKIGEDEYEFTMPATNVTITPEFRKSNIIDDIVNPKTGRAFLGIIIALLIAGGFTYKNYKNPKKS